jgi:hypothetical protein
VTEPITNNQQPAANNQQPTTTPPPAADALAPVPYERFAEVNKRANEMAARLGELEKERKEADDKILTEQNKWKELAEKRDAELQTERTARLRLDVALKAGLPPEFAGRLMGITEEELTADAKSLLPLVRPSTPGNPPATSRTAPTTFTAEQLNDPKFVRDNMAAILAQSK